MATIAVFGQRTFAAHTAQALTNAGHDVAFATSPKDRDGTPDPLAVWCQHTGTPWASSRTYHADRLPDDLDLIIAAHSHLVVGRESRSRAKAAIGYHPSLLPIHRGRDAVRWTIRDRDRVTGGTVYHLTDGIDEGPIAASRHVLVRPDDDVHTLWARLFTLGVQMLVQAADDYDNGTLDAIPQEEGCATWEPSWERPPLHRPELPQLYDRPVPVSAEAALALRLRG